MNREDTVSDETLNASIDGQLDRKDQARLMERLRNDPALAQRGCQLQKAHELVRLAYQSEQPHESPRPAPAARRPWRTGLVASLLIGFGMVLGLLGGTYYSQQPSSLLELASTVHTPDAGDKPLWRVLLHVSTHDPYRFRILLEETEKLLESSRKEHQAVEVQILANGEGLELVRNSNTPHARRLRALQDRYSNLVVSACNEALTRLRQKGVDIELLPQTRVVSSALDEILHRQKQGWTYIRI